MLLVSDIFPIEDGFAFNYSYFGLATISMILALIDGFIYFFQHGSCARGIRACKKKLREKHNKDEQDQEEADDDDDDDDNEQKKCCGLNKKWKKRFDLNLDKIFSQSCYSIHCSFLTCLISSRKQAINQREILDEPTLACL